MFEEKDIQFLDKTAKAFLSIVKKIVTNWSYSKAAVDSAIATGTAGLLSIRGKYDISGGQFPTTGGRGVGGLPKAGDGWEISVGGTAGGIVFDAGDNIVALIDTPAQTAANWQRGEGNLGFTPENSSNKENTTLDTSTSKYPTNRLVKEAVDTKQATLTESVFGAFIAALTAKATPVDADSISVVDSEDSNKQKKVSLTAFKAFLKTYFDGIYTTTAAVATQISSAISGYLTAATAASTYATISSLSSYLTTSAAAAAYQVILTAANFGDFLIGLTAKTTPVDADSIMVSDSAATDDVKKVSLTNFKAFLKTYFDGLYSATLAGSYLMWSTNTAPSGYLECNGTAVSRTTYAALFAVISTNYGVGNGSTTFNLPDFRGYFPRGWANGGSIDAGRVFGSTQTDAFQGHKHQEQHAASLGGSTVSVLGTAASNNTDADSSNFTKVPSTDGTNGTPRTAAETRPSNLAVMICIKT